MNDRRTHFDPIGIHFFQSKTISTGCDTALWMRTGVISSRPETETTLKMKVMASWTRQQLHSLCDDEEAWSFLAHVIFVVQNIIDYSLIVLHILQFNFIPTWFRYSQMSPNMCRIACAPDWKLKWFRPNWNVREKYHTTFPLPISFFCHLLFFFARKMVFRSWRKRDRVTPTTWKWNVTLSKMARSEILLIQNWMYFWRGQRRSGCQLEMIIRVLRAHRWMMNIRMRQKKLRTGDLMKQRLNLNISDFFEDGKYAGSYSVWSVHECKLNHRFFLAFVAQTKSIMDPAREERMRFFFNYVELIRCHIVTRIGDSIYFGDCGTKNRLKKKKYEMNSLCSSRAGWKLNTEHWIAYTKQVIPHQT